MGHIALEDGLAAGRQNWKRSGARVVLVHGAFDLLHPGHIRLLEQAKSLGDVLVVAVDSDASICSANTADSKGGNELEPESLRPVTPAAERVEIIAGLAAVDFVVGLDHISFPDFAGRLSPDVLVRGAMLQSGNITEADRRAEEIVKRGGGEVTIVPLEPGYSTISLMARIRQLHA